MPGYPLIPYPWIAYPLDTLPSTLPLVIPPNTLPLPRYPTPWVPYSQGTLPPCLDALLLDTLPLPGYPSDILPLGYSTLPWMPYPPLDILPPGTLPPREQINTSENITFPQLRWRLVKML